MKFKVTLKDPDGFSNCIAEAVEASASNITDPDEREAVVVIRSEKVKDSLEKWVNWGEYVTIEFDTEAMTAVVCEN